MITCLKQTANSKEICKTLTQNCLEEFIKEKTSDQRAHPLFVEDYGHDLFITFRQAVVLWKENDIAPCLSGKSHMRRN